jgi:hypothetical protein
VQYRQGQRKENQEAKGEVMKRLFPIVIALLFVSLAYPQMKSEQEATNIIIQPTKSVRGDSLKSQSNFTSNQWIPYHNGKALVSCRGACVLSSGTEGMLAVHLVGDPTGRWYKIELKNDGIPMGAEFDRVGDSTKGTTVKLDTNLFIYPHLYKNP